jgi:hypothetical protein
MDKKNALGRRIAAEGIASLTNHLRRPDKPVSSTYRSATRESTSKTPA